MLSEVVQHFDEMVDGERLRPSKLFYCYLRTWLKRDDWRFHRFLNDFKDSINTACQYGYNNALVILKLLNIFNIKELETPKLNSIELTYINVWNKVVEQINTD